MEYNEFVDMGLSVKWASCNVGASKPSDYGAHVTCDDANCTYSKDSGRVPTDEELAELFDDKNCICEWVSRNGHNGCELTSRKTGNSIFLPAAGLKKGNAIELDGIGGIYWSSSTPDGSGAGMFDNTSKENTTKQACVLLLIFAQERTLLTWDFRGKMMSVRLVSEYDIPENKNIFENEDTHTSMDNDDSSEEDEMRFIDLGLSVKWADRNMGADKPFDYGMKLIWEDANQSWWDDDCRLPTMGEIQELLDETNCTWLWMNLQGIYGFSVTSKKNGNSIFLPAGESSDRNMVDVNKIGCEYWSCTTEKGDGVYRNSGLLDPQTLGVALYVSWPNIHRIESQAVYCWLYCRCVSEK